MLKFNLIVSKGLLNQRVLYVSTTQDYLQKPTQSAGNHVDGAVLMGPELWFEHGPSPLRLVLESNPHNEVLRG
jgi:hypothetical protein